MSPTLQNSVTPKAQKKSARMTPGESFTICSSNVISYFCTHLFCVLILHTIFLILNLEYNTIRGLNINLVKTLQTLSHQKPKKKALEWPPWRVIHHLFIEGYLLFLYTSIVCTYLTHYIFNIKSRIQYYSWIKY